MAISAENPYMSKFAALHWQWWRLQMSEKSSSLTKNSKQTNKQKLIQSYFKLFHFRRPSFTPFIRSELYAIITSFNKITVVAIQ